MYLNVSGQGACWSDSPESATNWHNRQTIVWTSLRPIQRVFMYYRWQGFLAVEWFGSFALHLPSPVSKLPFLLSHPLCRPLSLLTGKGGGRKEPNHTMVGKPGPLYPLTLLSGPIPLGYVKSLLSYIYRWVYLLTVCSCVIQNRLLHEIHMCM